MARTITPEVWSACDLAPGDRVVAVYGTIAHRWCDDRFTVHAVRSELGPNDVLFTTLQVGPQEWETRTYRADTPVSVYPATPK